MQPQRHRPTALFYKSPGKNATVKFEIAERLRTYPDIYQTLLAVELRIKAYANDASPDLLHNALQATLKKVPQPQFESDAEMIAYLKEAMLWRFINYCARRAHRTTQVGSFEDETLPMPVMTALKGTASDVCRDAAQLADRAEILAQVRRAIADLWLADTGPTAVGTLKKAAQNVVTLEMALGGDLSQSELAKTAGCNQATISRGLRQAREFVRARIELNQ